MPEYSYHCTNCNEDVTVTLKMSEAPLKVCPKCKQENCLNRKFTPVSFVNNSGGFFSSNNIGSEFKR
jgi:putative FmdB family regulatory protein